MKTWRLTPSQWEKTSRDDRAEMMALLKAEAMMQSYEADEQKRKLMNKRQ